MIDQTINIPVYLLAASVAGVVILAILLAWVCVIRPLHANKALLMAELNDATHRQEITSREHAHRQERLAEQLSRAERELIQRSEELSQDRLRLQELAHKNASLSEQLKQHQALQQENKELQQRVVQLSEVRARLETDLESERIQLAKQAELIESAKLELKKEFELTANKLFEHKAEQFSQTSQNLLEVTLSPFKSQISEFRKKVEDVYDKENAERNKLAGQIVELQKQAHKIGEDAVNLARALKGNNKSQGGWGEVILERLLEQSGLQRGREYETQFQVKDEDGQRKIPDVVVHLPEGKDIVVDAKVSLTDYEKYCNADDDVDRQRHLQAHINSIRSHVRGLSAKDYEKLPGVRGLDFVFIFIPIEAAFMLALQNDMTLYSDAYNKNIVLASPTTLLAMLRTIENLWRHDKQNKNAERIAKEAGALHDQFVLLLEALDSVGDNIEKTQKAYNLVQKRLHTGRGNLLRKVEGIRKLGAKTKKTLPDAHKEALELSAESEDDEG